MTDKMTEAANLVREHHKVKTRLAALEAQEKSIRDRLLALGFDSGKHVTAAGAFTVSAVNEYPESAILASLSPGQAARCMKKVLDRPKVQALYPEAWAAAKHNKGQKVSVA